MTEGILTDAQVAAIRGPEEDAAAKRREKDRLRKQAERDAKKFAKEAELLETCEQWWDKNREAIARHEQEAMKAQHELVLDQLHWMEKPLTDPNDPDYVSLEEGTTDLVEFVRENPCPHLGYIKADYRIPMDWSTRRFWADSELLRALFAEGPATETYVRFGLLSSIPDHGVVTFLTEKAKYTWDDAAKIVGYKVGPSNNTVSYEKAS